MFELHETTQRRLCRAVFLLGCLAPTLMVVSWAAAVNSSAYEQAARHAWRVGLERELGMQVAIERVSYPARGVTLLENVRLTPLESTIPIAEARMVEIRDYQGGALVMASQLEVDFNRLPQFWGIFHERAMVRATGEDSGTWLRCAELHLKGGDREQTLVEVAARWSPAAQEGPTLLAEFELPEREAEEPCQLSVRRDRRTNLPTTQFELNTGQAALPCAVLADAFPLVDAFGERTTFQGRLQLTHSSRGFDGTIEQARLANLETQRLLNHCSLHTLRTTAEVRIASAQFQHGRLQAMAGSMIAGEGVIDSRFVKSLYDHLQIAAPEEVLAATQRKLSFDELAFEFTLTEGEGLYLQGACGGNLQGAMIVGASGPLLVQPQRPHQPCVALIRALVPANELQTPATRQTQQLVNALPLPDIRVSGDAPPSASLKLRSN